MILDAIQTLLVNDTTLTDQLAVYDFGDGNKPAIFTVDPMPTDANHPAVIITTVGGTSDFGTRAKKGGETRADVRVYNDKGYSRSTLDSIAWRLWDLLERGTLDIDGYEEVGVSCSPPIIAPDPDGFPGYRLECTIRILEV